jgi:hypothetical protein
LFVDDLLFGRERLSRAKFVEHVVHAGDRELGVHDLLTLAMGVKRLGHLRHPRPTNVVRDRKRKWLEAGVLVVPRPVL